jgi:anti-anti-sigma factor
MISGELDTRKKRLHAEVRSEVTSTQVQALRDGLAAIVRTYPTESWSELYLDLRNARMIDSMGMNWLFSEIRYVADKQKKLVLRISSPAIKKIFAFTGMDKLVLVKFRHRRQLR